MKIKAILSTTVLAVVIAGTINGPAYAAETPPPIPPEEYSESTIVEPLDATLVIDGKPTNIAVMPDFDPQAPAVVIDADGQPVPVSDISIVDANGKSTDVATVNTTDRAALESCWRSWVAPGTGTWYYSGYGCSLIGMNATARVGYGWTVDSNSIGAACLQGRGYQHLTYPGGSTWSEIYGGIGCGGGGDSGGGTLLWGEVASTKRIKMISYSTPSGAAGNWQ